jgi:glycosyltransferase involved in cell wall biosynthesis
MRVVINTVFLRSKKLGGSWTYSYNLLRALNVCADNIEIVVLANRNTARSFQDLGIRTEVMASDPNSRLLRVGWEQVVLPKVLETLRPDVFHSTGNLLPRRMRCHSVVTVHDFQYHYYPEYFGALRRIYLQHTVPRSMRQADAVLCVSKFTKRNAMELYGIPQEKLVVIHEAGLWLDEQATAVDGSIVKGKFGLGGPFLLSAGSSMPHKNLGRLIEAFGSILHRIPHNLVIVGEPFGHESAISKAIERFANGHRHRILVTGFVDRADLLGLYRCADAFVFPSLFEGFGIPALEAMGCGCPVVASRATSLPEIVGTAGEFFNPGDVDDIANALLRVCSDTTLRESLRARGFARATEFSWEKMGVETMQLYKRIAQG